MNKTKTAITLEEGFVKRLERLVRKNTFSNRSQAIQEAVKEKLKGMEHTLLARECAKLDPNLKKQWQKKV